MKDYPEQLRVPNVITGAPKSRKGRQREMVERESEKFEAQVCFDAQLLA